MDEAGPEESGPAATDRLRLLRVIPEVRTSNFEVDGTPRAYAETISYIHRKSDFDAAALPSNVIQLSHLGIVRKILSEHWDIVELPEPLWLRALPLSVVAGVAARLKVGRQSRPWVTTYTIENSPFEALASGVLQRVKPLARAAIRCISRTFYDQLIYGSDASRLVYAKNGFGPDGGVEAVFPKMQKPCDGCALAEKEKRILFLGVLENRKGVLSLLRAWATTGLGEEGWRLAIAGSGPLKTAVEASARDHESIEYMGMLDRASTHRELGRAAVVCLPSRRDGRWREQIGLPVVEGLSHGCTILATSDSGLAPWLKQHGHQVVPHDSTVEQLANSLISVCKTRRVPAQVLEDLPREDGVIRARRYMARTAVEGRC
ncbi:glycosyltransferase family 4 protein [Actinomycetospora aeridis]|uniref:Glycosyltransferase family 4 protein n=1 Tax=Actinomycetospora aeridis TaxID=3129231 RepID=A0ABU8N6F7_9PSEU